MKKLICISLALVSLQSLASAEVLISNLAFVGPDGTATATITTVRYKAMGFTTPATGALNLTRAVVRLSGTNALSVPVVEIRTGMGTGTAVGTVVHTLTPDIPWPTGLGDYTYNSSGYTFNNSATYWLVVRNENANTFNWNGRTPYGSNLPTGLATHVGGLFTTNGTSFATSVNNNTYEIVVNEGGGGHTITGTMNLNDTVGAFAATRNISYQVLQGATTVQSGTITSNATSTPINISIGGGLSGAATLVLNGSSFLRRAFTFSASGASSAIGTVAVKNGDPDASGEVDATDIDMIIADFGSLAVADTDLDVSGEVDATDIDIAIANFGQVDD